MVIENESEIAEVENDNEIVEVENGIEIVVYDTVVCEYCHKNFAYPSKLKRHLVTHTGVSEKRSFAKIKINNIKFIFQMLFYS
jgi:predicted transcriptional regulator